MKFDKHLFISYSHIDNEPVPPEQEGWISRFHKSLEAMLSMRLGRRATIWRDIKLAGNDVFADEISAQFPSTAVLLAVLSPRYVDSDWCTREAAEFCRAAEASDSLVVGNKARVFKIIKTPVDSQDPLPAVMRDTLGIAFYVLDDHQVPLELDPAYGADMLPKYNVKVATLAWEIAQLVKLLETTAANEPGSTAAGTASAVSAADAAPARAVVYLAEASYDLRDEREAMRAELRLRGHRVLPEVELPRDEAAYLNAVRSALAECAMAVHLVGARYGAVPDGPSGQSVVELQNTLAAEACRSGALERLIWVAADPAADDVMQQRFQTRLTREPAAQFGADLIATDLGGFKEALGASLTALEQRREAARTREAARSAPYGAAAHSDGGAARPRAPLVYLLCDERDRSATIPLRRTLRARGVDVATPVFEGDAATLRTAHEAQLAHCDAVLVWYGAGDAAWKRTVDHDLRKARGLRPGAPLPAPWVVVAAPATADKFDLIELLDGGLVDALEGLDEPALEPFLATLAP